VPARSAEVAQFATPVVEFTVAALLQLIALPLDVKLTVPEGLVGVNGAPLRVAVRVTTVFRFAAVVAEMVSVGLSWLMVWLTVAAVAVLKLASPG
jgi:hypothetical protein